MEFGGVSAYSRKSGDPGDISCAPLCFFVVVSYPILHVSIHIIYECQKYGSEQREEKFYNQPEKKDWSTFVPDVMDFVLYAGMLLYIHYSQRNRWLRTTSTDLQWGWFIWYIVFLLAMIILLLVGDGLSYSGIATDYCSDRLSDCVQFFLYPIIMYVTLREDSQFWRRVHQTIADFGPSTDPTTFQQFDSIWRDLKHNQDAVGELASTRCQLLDYARLDVSGSQMLGEGTFATIYKGTYAGETVAVKVLRSLEISVDTILEFCKEAFLCASVSGHPNLVLFRGVAVRPPEMFLVYEYCETKSLENLLSSKAPLEWQTRIDMIYQIAQGMCFLHRLKVIHRDLKPGNVVLTNWDGHYVCKICDFGCSRFGSDETGRSDDTSAALRSFNSTTVTRAPAHRCDECGTACDPNANFCSHCGVDLRHDCGGQPSARGFPKRSHMTTLVGTPAFLAPEIWEGIRILGGCPTVDLREDLVMNYDGAVDIFAYGCVLYCVITREMIFHDFKLHSIKQFVGAGHRLHLRANHTGAEGCPPKLIKLMYACWEQISKERPTFVNITEQIVDMDNAVEERYSTLMLSFSKDKHEYAEYVAHKEPSSSSQHRETILLASVKDEKLELLLNNSSSCC